MIGTIRKHSKWLWWIIAGLTIISFVVFMGSGPAGRNGGVRSSGGYGDGEQRRDFVYVRDLARMNLFFAGIGPYAPKAGEERKLYRGVVNDGTGASRSINDVARALMTVHGETAIEYIPFPADLEGRYQHFTEADLTGLRALGCDLEMTALEEGVAETCATLRAIGG